VSAHGDVAVMAAAADLNHRLFARIDASNNVGLCRRRAPP